jgi:hypothetical protein
MTRSDVLIIGAGPTGLVLALWLTKLGVAVRIIDKTAEPGTTSGALAVHARTLELYSQLDLADAVIEKGHKVPAIVLWVEGKREARVTPSLSRQLRAVIKTARTNGAPSIAPASGLPTFFFRALRRPSPPASNWRAKEPGMPYRAHGLDYIEGGTQTGIEIRSARFGLIMSAKSATSVAVGRIYLTRQRVADPDPHD